MLRCTRQEVLFICDRLSEEDGSDREETERVSSDSSSTELPTGGGRSVGAEWAGDTFCITNHHRGRTVVLLHTDSRNKKKITDQSPRSAAAAALSP